MARNRGRFSRIGSVSSSGYLRKRFDTVRGMHLCLEHLIFLMDRDTRKITCVTREFNEKGVFSTTGFDQFIGPSRLIQLLYAADVLSESENGNCAINSPVGYSPLILDRDSLIKSLDKLKELTNILFDSLPEGAKIVSFEEVDYFGEDCGSGKAIHAVVVWYEPFTPGEMEQLDAAEKKKQERQAILEKKRKESAAAAAEKKIAREKAIFERLKKKFEPSVEKED